MPSAKKETTIARQWELLRDHLPERPPGRTARELQVRLKDAGHEVTKRTVERDLNELSDIFNIDCNKVGIPHGWYWQNKKSFRHILGLDVSEAISLGLLEDILCQLMPPAFAESLENRFKAAREKLSALKNLPHAQWADLVRYVPPGMPQAPPTVAPGVFATIREALLENRQLAVTYRRHEDGNVSEQRLHPLSWIQHGTRSYLVASAFDYDSPLLYALHRFGTVEILVEPSKRPEGYSLDQFIAEGRAQFGSGRDLRFRASVTPQLAELLEESPLSANQKLKPDNDGKNVLLTATVKESWEFTFWILSQGEKIIVLNPVALRHEIKATLQASLENYQDD